MPSHATPFARRYKNLLDSEKHTDCSFIAGNSTINCHKLILSTSSSVFEAMLYGPLKEEKPIEIADISGETFYKLVEYIYTGQINMENEPIENFIELYYSADKYLLEDLSEICLHEIKTKLRFENVLPALDLSIFMNLKGLEEVCLSFFIDYCLTNFQFMAYIKSNYYHVAKDCMARIIEAAEENFKILFWFILEWCKNEYDNVNLTTEECKLIIKRLNFPVNCICEEKFEDPAKEKLINVSTSLIERTYYKAKRPFVISSCNREAFALIRPDRFIAVYGVVIHSRLMPVPPQVDRRICPMLLSDYKENLMVEIRDEINETVVYQHKVENHCTKYNCDSIILWNDMVTFDPRRTYKIKLIWNSNAFGAEYPTCSQSNMVNGINFEDMNDNFGGIIKGLKIMNL